VASKLGRIEKILGVATLSSKPNLGSIRCRPSSYKPCTYFKRICGRTIGVNRRLEWPGDHEQILIHVYQCTSSPFCNPLRPSECHLLPPSPEVADLRAHPRRCQVRRSADEVEPRGWRGSPVSALKGGRIGIEQKPKRYLLLSSVSLVPEMRSIGLSLRPLSC
jgi:hypothetical protein